MKSLERAIEFGSPVLLENVGEESPSVHLGSLIHYVCIYTQVSYLCVSLGEELDPSLEPILAKNVIDNGGGTLSLKVGDNVLDYNPAFMFYITTKLSNPHYTPEVSTKTTIAPWSLMIAPWHVR